MEIHSINKMIDSSRVISKGCLLHVIKCISRFTREEGIMLKYAKDHIESVSIKSYFYESGEKYSISNMNLTQDMIWTFMMFYDGKAENDAYKIFIDEVCRYLARNQSDLDRYAKLEAKLHRYWMEIYLPQLYG